MSQCSTCYGRVEEINGTITIATDKRHLYRFAENKWEDSRVSVNMCRLMKCNEKGYCLIEDDRNVSRHISEIENSTEVLAVLPNNHQLLCVSAIGHKDKIYVVGGTDSYFNPKPVISVLDVTTSKWIKLKDMSCGRSSCSLTTIDNKLYVGSGVCLSGSTNVECFDLKAEAWTSIHPTTNTMCHLSSLYDKLVATGGRCKGKSSNAVEVYDNATDSWFPLPSMEERRLHHGVCTTEDDKLFVVGGWCSSDLVECFQLP